MSKTIKLKRFKGINNISDYLENGIKFLSKAENIDITSNGLIVKRNGYIKTNNLNGVISSFNIKNNSKLFIIDLDGLKLFNNINNFILLKSNLDTTKSYNFVEINNDVYFSNGISYGIIKENNDVLELKYNNPQQPYLQIGSGSLPKGQYLVSLTYNLSDGRETGSSPITYIDVEDNSSIIISNLENENNYSVNIYVSMANSTQLNRIYTTNNNSFTYSSINIDYLEDLQNDNLESIPNNINLLEIYKSKLYTTKYFNEENITAIYYSEPLAFHLFDLEKSFILVKGKCTMLKAHDNGLIIGTDKEILVYDEEKIQVLANYGVVNSSNGLNGDVDDNGNIYFWTERGFCVGLPFKNISEDRISCKPGTDANTRIIYKNGDKKFISIINEDGEEFNKY